MGADLTAILEEEIQALRREADSTADPKRRQPAEKCYAIISNGTYAPRSYPEILHALGQVVRDAFTKASSMNYEGEPILANLVIFRSALVLERLVRNGHNGLQEFYDYMAVQEKGTIDEYIRDCEVRANWLSRIGEHRRPLDLLVNKGVRIEGDPYEEAVELLRKIESDLKKYRREGSFENVSIGSDDPVVAQALQRILRDITASKSQKRREELASRCSQLKSLFPEAAAQIDKMFRMESESLDDL